LGCFGWAPETFWSATIWEFAATFSGWKKRHGIKDKIQKSSLSGDEARDLLKWAKEERAKDDLRDLALTQQAGQND